jgi:cell division septum initiation protein DivIVA
MAPAEQAPIVAPAFAVVRRGYDPDQVAYHLNRVDAETTILAADRAAAAEQANQLGQQLAACRKELQTAQTEIERLRGELRVLAGPPDTVDSMNERLQVMLRLAKEEFTGLRADASAHAASHAAEIIAAVGAEAGDAGGFGFTEDDLRGPRDEDELERMRREAAEERSRLDDEAATRRAAADEEFRQVLALRCREAMSQLAKMQTEAMRSARRMMDEAEDQARSVLGETKEAVRRTVEDAQREVDDLQELRQHLADRLDTSRQLLDRAIPDVRSAAGGAAAEPRPTPAVRQPAAAQDAPTPAAATTPVPAPAQAPGDAAVPATAEPATAEPAAEPATAVPAASNGASNGASAAAAAHAADTGSPAIPTPGTPAQSEPAATDTPPREHNGEQPLSAPALPAVAAPPGWPVQPGPQPEAAEPGTVLEQTATGLADLGLVGTDTTRAQPMRIPPRDTEAPEVPGPSRVPVDEQDPEVAPPRRYP